MIYLAIAVACNFLLTFWLIGISSRRTDNIVKGVLMQTAALKVAAYRIKILEAATPECETNEKLREKLNEAIDELDQAMK